MWRCRPEGRTYWLTTTYIWNAINTYYVTTEHFIEKHNENTKFRTCRKQISAKLRTADILILPDGMSRRSFKLVCEILTVPISVRVFFILSIRNLDLQSGVCCIKKKEIFKGKASLVTWQSCHVPRLWTCLTSGFICHSSATELFASLTMTAYNQVFSHSVVNWWNTLLINCAS